MATVKTAKIPVLRGDISQDVKNKAAEYSITSNTYGTGCCALAFIKIGNLYSIPWNLESRTEDPKTLPVGVLAAALLRLFEYNYLYLVDAPEDYTVAFEYLGASPVSKKDGSTVWAFNARALYNYPPSSRFRHVPPKPTEVKGEASLRSPRYTMGTGGSRTLQFLTGFSNLRDDGLNIFLDSVQKRFKKGQVFGITLTSHQVKTWGWGELLKEKYGAEPIFIPFQNKGSGNTIYFYLLQAA